MKEISRFKPQDNINKIMLSLNNDGVFIIENFITDVSKIKEDCFRLCSQCPPNKYIFGQSYASREFYKQPQSIKQLFLKPHVKSIHDKYYKTRNGFATSVYMTHDFIPTSFDNMARNGYLHFDRDWYLKFFVYLTDVGLNDGPFSVAPGSTNKGMSLRSGLRGIYANQRNRIEIDYPELLSEYPVVPIEGKAGTLIVFDTDTFHKGGAVNDGGKRLIIRLHCK